MKYITPQILVLLIMWMMMYMMKFKKKNNTKIMSPFECGYNSFFSKMPMSIQFTMLVFMFLLFDIELSILISSNYTIPKINKYWIMTMITFFIFMITSVIYEMTKMSFKWK